MSATIVASSPDSRDRAVARSARYVARGIGSTYCLANVAICWPAKIVDATDYRAFPRDIIIDIDIMDNGVGEEDHMPCLAIDIVRRNSLVQY